MKKTVSLLLVFVMILAAALLSGCGASGGKAKTLNVYNWGEYISDGSEDSLDTIKAFESWYEETYKTKVKVNYSTFASNEDMYAKLSSGAVSYDVIFPSDYMIARMIGEGMLLPLNFDNIPNYQYINENFRSLYYDPDNTYSVPYTYNMVGIIYNANVVDEEDVGSWDLMWNEKYAGNILQFNNSRDAFGTAQYKLGLDVNSEDLSTWEAALAELKAQSPLIKSYVMDEIYNMMESGEAAIGAYYAGDYFTMLDAQAANVDLQFYYPDPTNYFVDAMCIPKSCQDKELAEIFINYMLSEEPAIANAEYTYYASPNSLVYSNEGYREDLGEDTLAILYPEIDEFRSAYNEYAFRNLSQEMLTKLNSLWESLKIS
ncbi:MAG: spermidine/putrescine ABC transporter substrate-binding protein [Oscillospiraceae bacterium]|nr:spermidine/putrescine ABC transporter substrate-binding protein [Oscillospiraceae bacterium]